MELVISNKLQVAGLHVLLQVITGFIPKESGTGAQ